MTAAGAKKRYCPMWCQQMR